jgi:hypothetical protein
VDDLRPQPRQHRRHTFREAFQNRVEQPPTVGVPNQGRVRRQVQQVLLVPLDAPARSGMEETAQGLRNPSGHLADAAQGTRVELSGLVGAPRQVRDQPREMPRATNVHGRDRCAVQGRPGHRQRQARVEARDVLDRGDLHLDHGELFGGIRDLQHPCALAADEEEVLVALADELAHVAIHAKSAARDLACILRCQLRGSGVQHAGRLHRAESYTSLDS